MRVYLGLTGERGGNDGTKAAGDGMRVYLGAPTGPAQERDLKNMPTQVRPLRILFSYHYYRDEDIDQCLTETLKGIQCDVFADSGAFSAWTTGHPITVKEYAAWLAKWGKNFTCAAALDVIGDAAASYRQTVELRKMVDPKLELIPVFHFRGSRDFDYLEKYLAAGFNYIGMGGLVGARNPALVQAWLTKCFQMKPTYVRFHGFGVTGWRTLKAFPWYSVDSSSWTSSFRYATLALFDARRGEWDTFSMRDPKALLAAQALLAQYGLRPSEVRADNYNRDKLCGACVLSWQRAEAWLEKWHKKPQKLYLGTVLGETTPNSPHTLARALKRTP